MREPRIKPSDYKVPPEVLDAMTPEERAEFDYGNERDCSYRYRQSVKLEEDGQLSPVEIIERVEFEIEAIREKEGRTVEQLHDRYREKVEAADYYSNLPGFGRF